MKFENVSLGAHPVTDWEFQFPNMNQGMVVTVDELRGDVVEYSPGAPVVYFKLSEKPSPIDPESTIPEQELYVPVSNVICITKTRRMEEPVSVEQKEEWQQLLREMSGAEIAN